MKNIIISVLIILILLVGCSRNDSQNKPYTVKYRTDYEDYKELDPYNMEYDEKIITAYMSKIDSLEKSRREEITSKAKSDKNLDYSSIKNLKYDLIFLNDDNIPELVVGEDDSWVSIYEFIDGEINLIKGSNFLISTDGNQAYEYIPKSGIVYNLKAEYGGMIYHYLFRLYNSKHEFDYLYNKDLCELHFEDFNHNLKPDKDENYSQDIHYYYFGDKILSEEEFIEYLPSEVYENLRGEYNKETMKEKLNNLIKE